MHRFYQMWQQLDCTRAQGCKSDLFPWVEETIGAGTNGTTKVNQEGSTAMGFYNVQQGDAPYLKYLADNFAMSDNYHQGMQGGTGANHVMLGFADAIWFSDPNFKPRCPRTISSSRSGAGTRAVATPAFV